MSLKSPNMNPISTMVKFLSQKARKKRASIFRDAFVLSESTKILDLGSESGSHIKAILQNTPVKSENVYIADINPELIQTGKDTFGFNPVLIGESEKLPFTDGYFDIVYCSSVIEHVTIPKEQVWSIRSGENFKTLSLTRQKEFALEIQRIGKQYFVQTPYIYFPIESHSWLPFLAWLPRQLYIPILKFTNSFWVKKTNPDWNLLNKKEMSILFKNARIVPEKWFGLIKSIMAIKTTCPTLKND